MSTSNDSEMKSRASDVHKEGLYGTFNDWLRKKLGWQDRLYKYASHKALDIPVDEMGDINANRIGIGAVGVAAIAAAVGIPPVALAAFLLWSQMDDKGDPSPIPEPPAVVVPDTEYEVRFYDRDGNPIVVPHINTRPK